MNCTESMKFTDTMNVVMKTICYLRGENTGNKALNHSEVHRNSAQFSSHKKPIARGSWYGPDANEVWQAIRKAIDGKLRSNHPVEVKIASFAEEDKRVGVFLAQLQKMGAEVEELKAELKREKGRYDQLEQATLRKRYIDGHAEVNFQKREEEIKNAQKKLSTLEKTLMAVTVEADVLRAENKKYQKQAGLTGLVEEAKYRLIEPKISDLADVHDNELMNAYQGLVNDAFGKLCSMSSLPKDVVFLFHAFNIDVADFVRDSVPFRFPEGNVVFACFVPNSERRRSFFIRTANVLDPFKPRVIIVSGGTRKVSEMINSGKVVNIAQQPGDVAINQRLWNAASRFSSDYDVIDEGYDEVKIVRTTNE